MRIGYATITGILPHSKEGYEKIEGYFVYPLNCARVSITFAKVIPSDALPEEVGERFEFSWIVPKDRPWKMGDRLAVKFLNSANCRSDWTSCEGVFAFQIGRQPAVLEPPSPQQNFPSLVPRLWPP
jgi:hypothetical protein